MIADEIFRSKIFPGETDLSVFRDFGRIPGLDIIFVENVRVWCQSAGSNSEWQGYGYHAAEDKMERLKEHNLGREGKHLYRLCMNLANAKDLETLQKLNGTERNKDDDVFFDFLGVHLFWYSADFAYFLNIGVAASMLLWILDKRGPLFLLRHVVNAIARFVVIILASVVIGVVMMSWAPLSWYR